VTRSILLVDDDAEVLGVLARFFEKRGWSVTAAGTGRVAIELFDNDPADIVLLDLELPDTSGLELLQSMRVRDADAGVVMLTGHGDINTAVEAMRAGAENFLTKPVDFTHLEAGIERAYEKVELRRHNRLLSFRLGQAQGLEALGASPAMVAIARQVELIASSDATALLTGETGTGKGFVAGLIHSLSSRSAAPMVEINCAGLTPTFLDSELFGHEKGAFTDAKTQKRGLFEVADRGTLFLDEIGDLASELQPKLLRVIESKRFRRLGGTRELHSDARLIAATNRDLEEAVRGRGFREDLYYRLAVFPLRLPALRERGREEILRLSAAMLREIHGRLGRGPGTVSPDAAELLLRYGWPGNIRELSNVLERAALLAPDAQELLPAHLPVELRAGSVGAWRAPEPTLPLAEVERMHIERVLAHCGGNRSLAARTLGISRATLYEKLRRYGTLAATAR
jgi:DNA-binding NtrC family response regulator